MAASSSSPAGHAAGTGVGLFASSSGSDGGGRGSGGLGDVCTAAGNRERRARGSVHAMADDHPPPPSKSGGGDCSPPNLAATAVPRPDPVAVVAGRRVQTVGRRRIRLP